MVPAASVGSRTRNFVRLEDLPRRLHRFHRQPQRQATNLQVCMNEPVDYGEPLFSS